MNILKDYINGADDVRHKLLAILKKRKISVRQASSEMGFRNATQVHLFMRAEHRPTVKTLAIFEEYVNKYKDELDSSSLNK